MSLTPTQQARLLNTLGILRWQPKSMLQQTCSFAETNKFSQARESNSSAPKQPTTKNSHQILRPKITNKITVKAPITTVKTQSNNDNTPDKTPTTNESLEFSLYCRNISSQLILIAALEPQQDAPDNLEERLIEDILRSFFLIKKQRAVAEPNQNLSMLQTASLPIVLKWPSPHLLLQQLQPQHINNGIMLLQGHLYAQVKQGISQSLVLGTSAHSLCQQAANNNATQLSLTAVPSLQQISQSAQAKIKLWEAIKSLV